MFKKIMDEVFSCFSDDENTCIIDGCKIVGQNSTMINSEVYVDGKKVDGININRSGKRPINIFITGNIKTLKTDHGNVTVEGMVNELYTDSGNITCKDVVHNITVDSGDIECGNVGGNITIKGSGDIKCEYVVGSCSTKSGDIVKKR